MKKTNCIRLLKISALALPVLLFVLFTQNYLFYFTNYNAERIRRFYQEEKNSLDVVFLGASDVYSGFAPALAYEQYGFTSYMYVIDANPGELYKYQLEEVLKHQNPQWIFVEVNGFLYDRPIDDHKLTIFTENIPMSLNKLEAVWRFKEEDKLSGIFPFVIYHGNWLDGHGLLEQLQWRISTSRTPSLLKGMATSTEIDKQLPEEIVLTEDRLAVMKFVPNLLDEFLKYCRENNLDNIVFVRFPHKIAEEHETNVEQLKHHIEAFGYPFLNLEEYHNEIGLDSLQDYYNPEHLNIYGQEKVTVYLGKRIIDDFHVVPAAQSESNRLHWENCIGYYHSFYEYAHENILNGVVVSPSEANPDFAQFLDWLNQRAAQ